LPEDEEEEMLIHPVTVNGDGWAPTEIETVDPSETIISPKETKVRKSEER